MHAANARRWEAGLELGKRGEPKQSQWSLSPTISAMRPAALFSLLLVLVLAICGLPARAEAVAAEDRVAAGGTYIRRIQELEQQVAQRDDTISELKNKLKAEVVAEKAAHATTKKDLADKLDACESSLEKQKAMFAALKDA